MGSMVASVRRKTAARTRTGIMKIVKMTDAAGWRSAASLSRVQIRSFFTGLHSCLYNPAVLAANISSTTFPENSFFSLSDFIIRRSV